jgi:hypothetical protein
VLLKRARKRELLAAGRRQLEIRRFIPDLQHEKSLVARKDVLEGAGEAGDAITAGHRAAESLSHLVPPAARQRVIVAPNRDDVRRYRHEQRALMGLHLDGAALRGGCRLR